MTLTLPTLGLIHIRDHAVRRMEERCIPLAELVAVMDAEPRKFLAAGRLAKAATARVTARGLRLVVTGSDGLSVVSVWRVDCPRMLDE